MRKAPGGRFDEWVVPPAAVPARDSASAGARDAWRRRRFIAEVEGASMAEYALLLSVITIALVLVVQQFGGSVGGAFARTSVAMQSVSSGTTSEGTDATVGGDGADGTDATDGKDSRGSCGSPPCGRGPDGQGPPGSRK